MRGPMLQPTKQELRDEIERLRAEPAPTKLTPIDHLNATLALVACFIVGAVVSCAVIH